MLLMIESDGSPPFRRQTDTHRLKMDGRNPRCGTMNAPNSPVYCVLSETHSVSGPPTLTCRVIALTSRANRGHYIPWGQDTHSSLFYTLSASRLQLFFRIFARRRPARLWSTHIPAIPGHSAYAWVRLAAPRGQGAERGEEYGWFPHTRQDPSVEPHTMRACIVTILRLFRSVFKPQGPEFWPR